MVDKKADDWQEIRLKHSVKLINEKADRWVSIPLKRVVKPKITDGPHETPDFVNEGIPFLSAEGVENGTINFERVRGYITPENHREYSKKCLPQRNDIFIVKSGSTTGKVGYVNTDIEFNIWSPLALIRANPKYCIPRFLYYSVCSEPFQIQVQLSWSFGTQPNIGMGVIENLRVFIPPLEQQKEIASFLDRKTAAIDALISKKQRLIELLEEKRSALINQAVTKGLNPNVPMKDSGIPWIGEIPEYWKVTKIKHLLKEIIDAEHKTAPFYETGEYLVLRTSNIRNGKLILDDAKYTDLEGFIEWTKRSRPQPGDIVFTREAPAGEACLVPENIPLCLGQRMVLFRVNHEVLDARFGVYSIYGGIAKKFIQSLSQGSTVSHFNMSDIGNIPIFLLPLAEQIEIVVHLDRAMERVNKLIAKVIGFIEKLQEYRQSLITAAVTGKLDITQEEAA